MIKQTYTYSELAISKESWQDIYDRLAKLGKEYLCEYFDTENETLVFGKIGQIKEIVECEQ